MLDPSPIPFLYLKLEIKESSCIIKLNIPNQKIFRLSVSTYNVFKEQQLTIIMLNGLSN